MFSAQLLLIIVLMLPERTLIYFDETGGYFVFSTTYLQYSWVKCQQILLSSNTNYRLYQNQTGHFLAIS